VEAVLTTMGWGFFPAKSVVPRRDRERLFLRASSHRSHRWRLQRCVVAGISPERWMSKRKTSSLRCTGNSKQNLFKTNIF